MTQRVFIANFGRGNYEWPTCLRDSTIATMNDEHVQEYWANGDRENYIQYCINNLKSSGGISPTRPVASRWFNLMTIVSESEGDIWIHRAKDELWWTISLHQQPTITLKLDPNPLEGSVNVYICHKPCKPWSNKNKNNSPLMWKSLRPKAKDFMFTEGSLQRLQPDNAQYALALIEGIDLSKWHNRPDWKKRQINTQRTPVNYLNPRQKSIVDMAMTAEGTARSSRGQKIETRVKNKEIKFTRQQLEKYLDALLQAQDGLCAISSLPLQYQGSHDNAEFLCSLDRIDSDGHYEQGNLQIVCRFINRWKRDQNDEEFRNLLDIVRGI